MGNNRKTINYYRKLPGQRRTPFLFRLMGILFKGSVVIGLMVLTSLFFILTYNQAVQWDVFNAKSITVKGNVRLTKDEIITASKINREQNILSMNLSTAKKHLLAHPMIAEVRLSRNFPSGITIEIKEHVPIALLDLGRLFAINTQGKIFIEETSADFTQLPVIVGFNTDDIDAIEELSCRPFNEVMKLLRLALKADSILPIRDMNKIIIDKQTGIIVSTSGRFKTIKFGYGGYANKYTKLIKVFSFLNTRTDLNRYTSIDLNILDRMVLKPS